ncbi:type zinc finger transcription factor family protein [Citrus sinensis]|uniref:Type zinc finger transcription factor family protein n=1 Tax=Citrus sinensis TaxID=2711 RepID=A0ACB8L2Z6_CITSI|nr:type zinc finger transcription factor family protein [Citrus sinensis]
MKRTFQEPAELNHSLNMANCLMFMPHGGDFDAVNGVNMAVADRAFECKTCNRQFPSFQALGGHRASHKKSRVTEGSGGGVDTQQSPVKPKTHECSVCGLEFAIGQALGGHMRRHRAGASHANQKLSAFSSLSDTAPLVEKANSRRVLCLDLNLTPYENDLEFYRLGSN